jgi:hypothetical protein
MNDIELDKEIRDGIKTLFATPRTDAIIAQKNGSIVEAYKLKILSKELEQSIAMLQLDYNALLVENAELESKLK